MKINELKKELNKVDIPKVPDIISSNILKYSNARLEFEKKMTVKPDIIERIILSILGSIPFFELFWYLNEKLIKRNDIKIKLHW